MKGLLVAAALAAGLWAGTAGAADLPSGGLTVDEVAKWLRDNGYKGEIKTDDEGGRYIDSAADGVNFQVYPYDCKDSRCAAIQFQTDFDTPEPVSAAEVNDWNGRKRYAKAYIDAEGDPFLNYDANLSPGGTYEALDDDLGVWEMMLNDFLDFLDW